MYRSLDNPQLLIELRAGECCNSQEVEVPQASRPWRSVTRFYTAHMKVLDAVNRFLAANRDMMTLGTRIKYNTPFMKKEALRSLVDQRRAGFFAGSRRKTEFGRIWYRGVQLLHRVAQATEGYAAGARALGEYGAAHARQVVVGTLRGMRSGLALSHIRRMQEIDPSLAIRAAHFAKDCCQRDALEITFKFIDAHGALTLEMQRALLQETMRGRDRPLHEALSGMGKDWQVYLLTGTFISHAEQIDRSRALEERTRYVEQLKTPGVRREQLSSAILSLAEAVNIRPGYYPCLASDIFNVTLSWDLIPNGPCTESAVLRHERRLEELEQLTIWVHEGVNDQFASTMFSAICYDFTGRVHEGQKHGDD